VNPLFADGLRKSADECVQSTTLDAWLSSGLRADKVVLQIPAYGTMQTLLHKGREDIAQLGDPTVRNKMKVVPQQKVFFCLFSSLFSFSTTLDIDYIEREFLKAEGYLASSNNN